MENVADGVQRDIELPTAGDIVGEHFVLKNAIGRGSMGVVMRAVDELLHREVAIKIAYPGMLVAGGRRRTFLQEARAMARVHHPNVVTVYSFGEIDVGPFIVMEYVPGTNLRQELKSRPRPFSPGEATDLLGQISAGVDAIHAAGAVHRDIKPSNILIGPGRRIAITDLGIAHLMGSAADASGVIGTLGYMAPEVGSRVDPAMIPRQDVYSVGIVAYRVLTGRLPFEARSHSAMRREQAEGFPPASTSNPALPREVDALLNRALAPTPQERFATAGALAEGLREALRVPALCPVVRRVVIADDDPDMRAAVAAFVEQGHPDAQVALCTDGAEAFEELLRSPADLAIVDLQMPRCDGLAFTERVRNEPRTQQTPIIVMTGKGGAEDWQRLSKLGAKAFLVKPFDADTLMSAATRVLAMRPGRDD